MNTHAKASLSDIRTSILHGFPLTTEECGHLFYDGGVNFSELSLYFIRFIRRIVFNRCCAIVEGWQPLNAASL
jgi:hypothetical protein